MLRVVVSAFFLSFSLRSSAIDFSEAVALFCSVVIKDLSSSSSAAARVVSSEIFLSSSVLAPSKAVVSALVFIRF
nr:MAG TPA: hypothetical protein [Caudoviricetes sp.]